jgi:hypothetical protein
MLWKDLEDRLEAAFASCGPSEPKELSEPFPLARSVEALLTPEEQEELAPLEDSPGSVVEVLERHGIGRTPLLDVYWDGFGPVSWDAGIELIGSAGRSYLCYWADAQPWSVVAQLDMRSAGTVERSVRRLLWRNGARFGLALFGSLPTATINCAPTLLPGPAVKRAYFELMQWWESTEGSSWIGLADEHFGRIVEPNHLTRSLDLLETFSAHSSPAALAAFLEERAAESAAMPLEVRRRLFDDWFQLSYTERPERMDK